MDSFRPLISFERRSDDLKMIGLRIVSAVTLVFFVIQLAKEPENLSDLTSFTNDSMNDLFNWGNDRFVLGKLADNSGGNGTAKRKKSPQEIFMEAILEEEEEKPKEPEPTKKEEETDEKEDHTVEEPDLLDRDTLGGTDDD